MLDSVAKEAQMVEFEPYWKYCQRKGCLPYWDYRLRKSVDKVEYDRLKVFKRDGLKRLWFLTDYVVPCDKDGNFLTISEVANPDCKVSLAVVIVRREEGGTLTVDLLFDDFSLSDPIILTANEISIRKDNRRSWRSIKFHHSFENTVTIKYIEYIEATERWMYDFSG